MTWLLERAEGALCKERCKKPGRYLTLWKVGFRRRSRGYLRVGFKTLESPLPNGLSDWQEVSAVLIDPRNRGVGDSNADRDHRADQPVKIIPARWRGNQQKGGRRRLPSSGLRFRTAQMRTDVSMAGDSSWFWPASYPDIRFLAELRIGSILFVGFPLTAF
jgi:hypothetical protein